ncbi:MAG: radical SAM protein [Dehalococcoidia bacterium]
MTAQPAPKVVKNRRIPRRGYLVGTLNYPGKYLRKGLFQTIFHVTYRCNSRCLFCFNREKLNTLDDELDTKEIELISRSMPQFPWLMLSGGEPLLRTDVDSIIKVFISNNNVRHVTLPTNGLLPARIASLCESILSQAKSTTLTLAVSIDDTGGKHDKLRGVAGNFDAAIETIKAAIKIKRRFPALCVKVNTVVGAHNCDNIDEVIQCVAGLGVDMHTIDIIRDIPGQPTRHPSQEAIEEILLKAIDMYEYYNGYENIGRHMYPFRKLSKALLKRAIYISLETVNREKQVIPCYAGRVNTVIYPDGDIAPCEMLPSLGNLRDSGYDFQALWNSREAQQTRKSIRRGECYCYHPCYTLTNILFNPLELVRAIK